MTKKELEKSILERNRALKAIKPTAHELERIKKKEEDRRMAVWYKHTTRQYRGRPHP